MVEKYGVENPSLSPELRAKANATVLKRFNVRNAFLNPDVRKKYERTMMSRYGVTNPSQNLAIRQKQMEARQKTLESSQGRSKPEAEIQAWLLSIGVTTVHHSSRAKELDLYSPEHSIGIEHNGLWFHSELFRSRRYHLDKTEMYAAQGVRVIHIWGHWWSARKEQVKGFLRSMFQKNTIVYARKTELRQIDKHIAWDFVDKHHIQPANRRTRLALGLFHEGCLISVATFSAHHRNNNEIVLDRFCGDGEHTIVGGLSRVSKYAYEHFKCPIYTWADRCISDGNGYEQSGWVKVNTSAPSYFYWNSSTKQIASKQSRRKKAALPPEGTTEHQFALSEGWLQIYDCGKYKFKFSLPE
jgi:hypothetical protein